MLHRAVTATPGLRDPAFGGLFQGDDHRAGGRPVPPSAWATSSVDVTCAATWQWGTPTTRQHGGWHAVERYPRHSAYTRVRSPSTQQYGANA
jgi:hypothetical protein